MKELINLSLRLGQRVTVVLKDDTEFQGILVRLKHNDVFYCVKKTGKISVGFKENYVKEVHAVTKYGNR